MNKKIFYFLVGLPRSGSTLLTALLNQHPEIYASESSPVRSLMANMDSSLPNYEVWQAGYRHHGFDNVVKEIANSFYFDINKPIIIDKDRNWGTPFSLEFAKILNPHFKFIITLRPILEVIASLINLMEKNPQNLYDNELRKEDFYAKYYKTPNDARCDYIMRSNGTLDMQIFSIANIIQYPENIHIVWYDNLINNTQEEMNKIHSFLGLKNYSLNLNKIESIESMDDLQAYGIKDFHKIKSNLQQSKTNPSDCLSNYVINKYGKSLDFLNNSLPTHKTYDFLYPNVN